MPSSLLINWLSCEKYRDNIDFKKVIMTNKVVRQKSRSTNCMVDKSRVLKQNSNRKSNLNKINPKLFIY